MSPQPEKAGPHPKLLEHSQELWYSHDLQGRILSVNPAVGRLLGRTAEELLQTSLADLVPPQFRDRLDAYLQEIQRLGEACGSATLVTRSGEWRTCRYHSILQAEAVDAPVVRGVAHPVTGQKSAGAPLESNEASFRAIYDRSTVGIALLDFLSGRILQANPKYSEMTGRTEQELRDLIFQSVTHPDDLAENVRKMEELAKGCVACLEMEKRYLRPDGAVRWANLFVIPMWGEGQRSRCALVVLQDITDRKQAEETLRQSEGDLKHAEAVAHLGSWRYDMAKNTLTLSDELYRILGLPVGTAIAPEKTMEFLPTDDHEHIVRTWTAALESGQFDQECRLLVNGAIRVVHVQAQVERDATGRPTKSVGTMQDITDGKQVAEALRRSEEHFRTLVEQASDGIGTVDTDGKWIDINSAGMQMLGLTREEYLGRKVGAAVIAEEKPRVARELADLHPGQNRRYEFTLRRKDGSWFPCEISAKRLPDGRVQIIGRDITDRKRAEEALRESEERFRSLYENSTIGLYRTTPDGRILLANPSLVKMLGFSSFSELSQRNLEEEGWWPGYNRSDFKRQLENEGEVRGLETSWTKRDGTAIFIRESAKAIRNAEGEIVYYEGTVEDITERKRAEEALRQSEAKYRRIVDTASEGIWVSGGDLLATFVNARMAEMLGYQQEEMLGRAPTDFMFEEDIPDHQRRMEGRREGMAEQYERRLRRKDGQTVWTHVSAVPIFDEKRCFQGSFSMCTDITERKRIEDELRQAKDRLAEEKLYLEQEINTDRGFDDIVGSSKAIKNVMEQVAIVAPSDATVLLLGETGTGKELVAHAVHQQSQRHDQAFIKMNCAAIPSGLLESELFGYEKGAFTGATGRKAGRIELADKGTLFLDEIGEIPLALQPKLLRLVQDHEFERLGGTHTLKSDFRLITATNRDLLQSVSQNHFRRDLYYRLNVFPIRLPSLRERREDIPSLVEYFVRKFAQRLNKSVTSIPKKTMESLTRWDWPGNVRELENFIERSVILTTGSVLACPLTELWPDAESGPNATLEAVERRHILNALRESRGQLSGSNGAASRLGLKRTTLQSKLKQFGIDHRQYRDDRRQSA